LAGRGGWLVVFDNAEDPDQLREVLPDGPGQVLITSRDPGWRQLATATGVDVFARTESVALLRAELPGISDDDADAVAGAVGDLPLAVVQAAGFMAESGMTPGEYVRALSGHAVEILGEGRPVGYPRSAAASIAVAVERLQGVDPVAVELLRVCAFLGPEPVPLGLAAAAGSLVGLRRSVQRLVRYGLIRLSGSGDPIVHRVTAAIVRDGLDPDRRVIERARAEAVVVAADPADITDPGCWEAWARLTPHLSALDPTGSGNPRLRNLVARAVWVMIVRGDPRAGRDLAGHLYTLGRDRLGPDDPDTLNLALTLAYAHRALGDHRAARTLDEDTLARRRRVLGEDHPDTLASASNLANDLREVGEVAAARALDEDTLARSRRVLGDDHPDTLASASNLALDLREVGEVAAARALDEDTLARSRRVLGDDHPDTLTSANNLANDLRDMGEVAAARVLDEDTLARSRRVLGEDHPDTLRSANNLALDLSAAGEVAAARALDEDTLTRRRRVLGEDHPDTLTSANNLAIDLREVGEVAAARVLEA
jgi:hypothetical protein